MRGPSGLAEYERGLVSILIPVYNAERYLDRCLGSVMDQTHGHVEAVCVDDGSTDGSREVLRRWQGGNAGRVRVILQDNQGVAKARNAAISAARGEYLAFLDNDDYLESDFVERSLAAARAHDSDVVCSGYQRPDSAGIVSTRFVPTGRHRWERYMVTAAWAKLYRHDFVSRNRLEFFSTNIGEDIYFTLPAVVLAQRLQVIPYCGYNWYLNEESVSSTLHRTTAGLQYEETLDACLNQLNQRGIGLNDELTHYFVRSIAWYVLYTAKGDGVEFSRTTLNHYYNWLDSHIDGWQDDCYAKISLPKGDTASARIATWLFVRHPRWFRLALSLYSRE